MLGLGMEELVVIIFFIALLIFLLFNTKIIKK